MQTSISLAVPEPPAAFSTSTAQFRPVEESQESRTFPHVVPLTVFTGQEPT
jgi:hypothetical protein